MSPTQRKAIETALTALRKARDSIYQGDLPLCHAAIDAITAALAETDEPVAWYRPSEEGYDSAFRDHATVVGCTGNKWEGWIPLYTHPPRREPLTDSAIHNLAAQCVKGGKSVEWALRELERAHGIGGES